MDIFILVFCLSVKTGGFNSSYNDDAIDMPLADFSKIT